MGRVATRYARAYYGQMGNDPKVARAELEALSVVGQLFEHPAAAKLLKSPVMPSALKQELLNYALDLGKATSTLRTFLTTLIAGGRIAEIPSVIVALEALVDDAEGRVKADLSTAVPVEAQTTEAIAGALSGLLKKKVELTPRVDPDLLGGFVVRVGNNLVDLSLKTRLDALSVSAVHGNV